MNRLRTVIIFFLMIFLGAGLRAEGEGRPDVYVESGQAPASTLRKSRKANSRPTEIFHYQRMTMLHPVQKQVICRLAGDENMSFAHSVLVHSIVEQFKVLPGLGVDDRGVAEAIELLENFWHLIQKVPGTELRRDPLYQLKDDPNARFGLVLWAKHVCSPDNILCEQG